MDVVLCRLQSIRQSIEHVVPALSADQEERIQESLRDIYNNLESRKTCSEDTMNSLCEEILFMLSEIESILYIPVVNHMLTQVRTRVQEIDINYDKLKEQHEDNVCPTSQRTEVSERLEMTHKTEVCKDETATDGYWVKRRDRINDLLGNTSLRFDKSCLKRKKQKSISWHPSVVDNDTELPRDQIVSHSPRPSEKRGKSGKYSRDFIDSFWGLTEDAWEAKQDKKWKAGEIICVLNCKSELRKFQEFLKEKKQVRSFYIQRKPNGLAGCKGTWLTPPYSPPLVVKYGCPGKRVGTS